MLIVGIIVGLIILMLLVAVHEYGHGIAARRNGVKVEEFSIGFPPKIYSRIVKDSLLGKNVRYTLSWLPLGGFVKLQGEHDSANKKGDYGAATYWQKTKILLAGVAMNWVIAIVLFTILALFGLPKILPDQFFVAGDTQEVLKPVQIVQVVGGSPADKAGLKQGDQILRVNGASVETSTGLNATTKQNKGKSIEIIYSRAGTEYTARPTLNQENKNSQGFLGVGTGQQTELKSTWSAPIVGVGVTAQFTWVTLSGTGKIAANAVTGFVQLLGFNNEIREAGKKELGTVSQSVAGPVGILGTIFPQAQQAGIKQLTFLTAIISLSLAVMNTLPIPALDGGRWFLMTVFKVLKKPLTKEREEKFQTFGFFFLMGLVVLITYADVTKLFR